MVADGDDINKTQNPTQRPMLSWDNLPCKRDCVSKECFLRHLKRRFPPMHWVPTITLSTFLSDLAGGITVGLTAIPQSLAYAQLASMPLEYGLYTTIVSGFLYSALGSAKDVNLGPTSLVSLLTGGVADDVGVEALVHSTLCFFTGLILIAFAFLRLEILLNIFPITVTSGFTSAAAILIITSQLKYYFGIPKLPRPFIEVIPEFFKSLPQTNLWDFIGATIVLAFLLGVQYTVPVFNRMLSKRKKTRLVRITSISLMVFNTLRAIIAIVVSSGIAYAIHVPPTCTIGGNMTMLLPVANCTAKMKGTVLINHGLTLTGPVPRGVPKPGAPPFGGLEILVTTTPSNLRAIATNFTNTTTETPPMTKFFTYGEMLADINIALIIIPLISTIELLAIGRAMAQKNGYQLDASQDMFACGAAHLVGAFLNAYPSSASITRSALNSQCEVKTQLCSIVTALLVLIAASTIADTCLPYVPKSCLAAVVIAAALSMIETHMAKMTWKVNKIDILPTAITFIACLLLDIEYGILVGVVASLIISSILSMRSVRTKTIVKETRLASVSSQNYLVVTMPQGELRYPCADTLKKMWQKTSGHAGPVAIDCSEVREVDFATIMAILQLAKTLPIKDATPGRYPMCMVGLEAELLGKFKNAVNVLEIKPPSHRQVHFASTLLETINVCGDGVGSILELATNSVETEEEIRDLGDIEMGPITNPQTPIQQSCTRVISKNSPPEEDRKNNRRKSM